MNTFFNTERARFGMINHNENMFHLVIHLLSIEHTKEKSLIYINLRGHLHVEID